MQIFDRTLYNSYNPDVILTLDHIAPSDSARVGGKAYNCARLKQASIPVPDGIVLPTEAMGGPLDAPELQDWLARLPRDTSLAVRSSATGEDSAGFSFAGIHETKLNVTASAVPDAVRACWASVTSPQAIAYRRAQRLSTENPKTAVLIQRMIRPVTSGVAFTMNPVSGAKDELLINSVFGFGEALVGGQVEPDEFRLRKSSGQMLSSHLANSPPSLSAAQLRELATLLLEIEQHYNGKPQDVEWCHDGAQFWIVQSRPVTTGNVKRDTEWTRANAREVLPDLPSTMTAAAVLEALNRAESRFAGKLLAPEEELGPMVGLFFGRMYFNVDQVRHICRLTGAAPAGILRSLGHAGEIRPEDEFVQRPSIREFMHVLPDIARIGIEHLRVRSRVREQLSRTERLVAQFKAQDLRKPTDQEIWAMNKMWRRQIVEDLQLVLLLAGVSMYEAALRRICKRAGFSYERLVHTYLAAGEKSVSAQQAFDLLRLARIARANGGLGGSDFTKSFEEFIRRYGHRGPYESDVSMKRYGEDPSPLLFAIRAHISAPDCPDPELIMEHQEEEAAKAWKEFEARLNLWQRVTLLPRADWLLRRAKRYYLWRELARSELIRIAAEVRGRHLALASRFAERGWLQAPDDYFFLMQDEVGAAIQNPAEGRNLSAIVVRRKAERERWSRIEMPLLMRESQLPALMRLFAPRIEATNARVLSGLCVSAGCAEGEVVVMRDPGEFARMKRGAILVAPATDPSWTPLFTLASGVIVEVGGMLSHASTVAREYGLPALANVKHATKILKTGDRVRLNATEGIVELITTTGPS